MLDGIIMFALIDYLNMVVIKCNIKVIEIGFQNKSLVLSVQDQSLRLSEIKSCYSLSCMHIPTGSISQD